MCGISGDIFFDGPPIDVRPMTRALTHRGPDAEGYYTADHVALGHRRLSILDIAGGVQPMIRDGVALVFNGQAYEHEAVREELRALGHVFSTRSDTEVVLVAYLQWGEQFVEHLHGMFAIALWDSRPAHGRRGHHSGGDGPTLVLARDRLGKKPLYYSRIGDDRLVFASELKALILHPAVSRELDLGAFAQYLAVECVPSPRSIYAGTYKLPPAYVAVFSRRGFALRRYWQLPTPAAKPAMSFTEAAVELRALLDRAVQLRLVADVPVGVFLSGGVDSSAIAALAIRHHRPLQTFSIGFHERSFDETTYARIVAKHLGSEHHEERLSATACLDLLAEAVDQLDEPFADPSYLPTLLLSRFVRQHVTVALSGDGGDELFAGYDPFLAHHPAQLAALLPHSLRSLLSQLAGRLPVSDNNMSLDFRIKQFLRGVDAEPSVRHQAWIGSLLPSEIETVLIPELRQHARHAYAESAAAAEQALATGLRSGSIDQALHFYLTRYLPDDILFKADRASMSASLELRAPFLDTHVVEFAAGLPASYKLSLTQTKRVLKQALTGFVPDQILHRQKKGFGIPVGQWIRGPLRPLFDDLFSRRSLQDSGVFDPATTSALLDRHLRRQADLRKPLFTIAMFLLWQRRWQSVGVGIERPIQVSQRVATG